MGGNAGNRIQVVAPFHTRRLACHRHKIKKNYTPDIDYMTRISMNLVPLVLFIFSSPKNLQYRTMKQWCCGAAASQPRPATAASLVTCSVDRLRVQVCSKSTTSSTQTKQTLYALCLYFSFCLGKGLNPGRMLVLSCLQLPST